MKKKPTLSSSEVAQLAEKLVGILECDETSMALMTLLIVHLEEVREDYIAFSLATDAIKQRLFVVTPDSEQAQKRFEAKAKAQRGTLLEFPNAKAS